MSEGLPRRLVVDHENGRMTVERADGTLVVRPMRMRAPAGTVEIRRSDYDIAARELVLTLPAGDHVTIEVGAPGDGDRPGRDRPVVYLDQNHWVALARCIYNPAAQPTPEVNDAASVIIGLARSGDIILPLSSAHLFETARKDGRQRRQLATTMLSLSRGWQMRNPLAVRRAELSAAMRCEAPLAADVITLAPDVVFASGAGGPVAPSDFGESWRSLYQRIVSISAIYAVMIEDEREDLPQARDLAARWAGVHDQLARHFRADQASKDEIEAISFQFLLADLQDEIVRAAQQAGITPARYVAWLEQSAENAIAQMPHLGRLRHLVLLKLRNADEKWEPNDLADTHFLTCAAGYADLVVGERKHINLLRRTMREVPDGAQLERTLVNAVAWLSSAKEVDTNTSEPDRRVRRDYAGRFR
jgi:hypothetical protein